MKKLVGMIVLFIVLSCAAASDYMENKDISNLLDKEGFKFFDTLDQYVNAYGLQNQSIYYHKYINIYNDYESAPTGMMGHEHRTPTIVGAFVVNMNKEVGQNAPIMVRKAYMVSKDIPSTDEVHNAFIQKYGTKNLSGGSASQIITGQSSSVRVKHKGRYLHVSVRVEPIGNGERVITYDVTDYTKAILADLANKERAKNIFN